MSYPKVIWRLREILNAGKYDAMLSLGLFPNVVSGIACRMLAQPPAIVMTEITRPHTESSRFSGSFTGGIRQLLYLHSYRTANVIAANSEDGIREMVAYYDVEAERTIRLPNLIEVQRVRGLAISKDPLSQIIRGQPSRRICMVARFEQMKRFDTLLMAARNLDSVEPWHIDLVGDGPYRNEIEKYIRDLDLGHRVTLHGWLSNPYPIIAAASATVLCSEYEGFSNTILESMALGTPVVTSFCSMDARKMVAQDVALGFQVGDWRGLRDHLKTVLTRPEICSHLVNRAFDFLKKHEVYPAIREYENAVRLAIENKKSNSALIGM